MVHGTADYTVYPINGQQVTASYAKNLDLVLGRLSLLLDIWVLNLFQVTELHMDTLPIRQPPPLPVRCPMEDVLTLLILMLALKQVRSDR